MKSEGQSLLLQQRETENREETGGDKPDFCLDPRFHSKQSDNTSDTDNDDDWEPVQLKRRWKELIKGPPQLPETPAKPNMSAPFAERHFVGGRTYTYIWISTLQPNLTAVQIVLLPRKVKENQIKRSNAAFAISVFP